MTRKEYQERKSFWITGHGALKSLIKTVHLVAGEIQKHEGGTRDALMKDLHERLSPIYRTTRRLMRQAFTDEEADKDPELAKLRREIDGPAEFENDLALTPTGVVTPLDTDVTATHVNAGNSGPLDDPAVNADPRLAEEMKKPKKAFDKAFTGWPMGPSRATKRAGKQPRIL